MVRFVCECGKQMQARAEYAGRLTKCPACGSQVPIPDSDETDGAPDHEAPARIRADRPAAKHLPVEKLEEVDDEDDVPVRGRNRRSVKRKSRPVWIWIAASAALLLLLVGGGIGAWFLFRSGPTGDLALIPGNAQGFVTVRVADVWKHDATQKALQQLKQQMPEMPDAAAEMEKETGLTPADVERASFVFQDAQNEVMWGIVLLSKPIDKAKILEKIGNPAETKQGKGSYYRSTKGGNLALSFVTDKLILAGPEAGVKFALDYQAGSQKSGPLDGAIKLAGGKHHIVGGVVPPPALVQQARANIPPQMAQYQALLDLQSATLTMDMTDSTLTEISLNFPADAKAKEAKTAIDGALGMAKGFLPFMKGQGGPPEAAKAFDQIQAALDSIKIEQKGSAVAVSVTAPLDTSAIVTGLLLPAVQKTRGAATKMSNANNLRQLVLAMHNYHDTRGRLPPAVIYSKDGKPLYSWRVELLPYLGQEQLYQQFKKDEAWDGPNNKRLLARMPPVFDLPGKAPDGQGLTYYQVFTGPGTPFNGKMGIPFAQFTDGTSNTILIVEATKGVPWTAPQDIPYTAPKRPTDPPSPIRHLLGGHFGNVFHVAMADGSTLAISKMVSDQTLNWAINPSDGHPPGPDWRPAQ
jgi:hypothetical protein